MGKPYNPRKQSIQRQLLPDPDVRRKPITRGYVTRSSRFDTILKKTEEVVRALKVQIFRGR